MSYFFSKNLCRLVKCKVNTSIHFDHIKEALLLRVDTLLNLN